MAENKNNVLPLLGAALGAGALAYTAGVSKAQAAEQTPAQQDQLSTNELLQKIIKALEEVSNQLQSIASKLTRQPSAEPIITISSEDLNKIIQAAAKEGDTMFPNYQVVVLVPAGGSVTVEHTVPEDFVDTARMPLEIFSDYYSPEITVEVIVDYSKRVTPTALSLTGPFKPDFGSLYVKRRAITLVFNNNAAVDANITYLVRSALFYTGLYDDWYRLILQYSFDRLSEIALAMGGRRI